MNDSSLFSFDESSAWDPKVIRKRLVVSQDQLLKLNSIPGWAKVQDNQDTLRLDKDFSIESSQSDCSIYVTQNGKIENNTKLFNDQIENRKTVLETCRIYGKRLTRSLSLFSIPKSCENLSSKTLKRTLSLQSVYESSKASDINAFKYIRCENSTKKHSQFDFSDKTVLRRQLEYIFPSECKISHSEPWKIKELFLRKENSEIMETVSQLPLNIPTTIEKPTIKENNDVLPAEKADQLVKQHGFESVNIDAVDLHPETSKEDNNLLLADNVDLHSETVEKNNGILPDDEDIATQSNNKPDQLKHVAESMNGDRSDSHSETTEESKDVLPVVNVTQCTDVSNESAKIVNDTLNVGNSVSSLKNLAKSCVPVADGSNVEEIPAYKISVFASEKAASPLNIQEEGKFLSSHLSNENGTSSLIVKETISESCSASISNAADVLPNPLENTILKKSALILEESRSFLSKSAEEVTIPDKKLGSGHFIGNCNSDMNIKDSSSDIKMENGENDQKECDPAEHVKVKSVENDQKESDLAKYIKMKNGENDQKEYDPAKSSANNETSSVKKRKLESRNKRSKKLKSEEKQGTLKIRSIKKVGEIYYSAEEVKTMLDIMKQFS